MDQGQKNTEAVLKDIERRINKEYAQAIEELEVELIDYFQRFEKKDETWQKWVESGKKTQYEYDEWRKGQMAVGRRWNDQKEMLARRINKANEEAKGIIKKYTPQIYADNYNYGTYEVEKEAKIDTSFNLFSGESVERLIKKDPEMLPEVWYRHYLSMCHLY